MYRRILSLLMGLLAAALLAGLSAPSHASSTGRVYFSGNITMPDKSLLKVYVSGTINLSGRAYGSIALLGPCGRLMSQMCTGEFTSTTTATVCGNLTFNGVPAQVRIDVTKSGTTAMLGWRVVDQNGNVLWTSGTNSDGSILQKKVVGICFMLLPN